MAARVVGGVFVGGASSRMGQPKGLLPGPDGRRLIDRAREVLRDAGVEAVLVGRHAAYLEEGPIIEDAIEDAGPLSGLVGLLEHAAGSRVFALACDMPFVTVEDVRALLSSPGSIAAPRRDDRWEPLCAAYRPEVLTLARERLSQGRRSLQGLLKVAETFEVVIPADHLVDWDTPEDVRAS